MPHKDTETDGFMRCVALIKEWFAMEDEEDQIGDFATGRMAARLRDTIAATRTKTLEEVKAVLPKKQEAPSQFGTLAVSHFIEGYNRYRTEALSRVSLDNIIVLARLYL